MTHICEKDPIKNQTRKIVIDQIHRFLVKNPTIKNPKVQSLCGSNMFFEKRLENYIHKNLNGIKPVFECYETNVDRFKSASKLATKKDNLKIYNKDILNRSTKPDIDIAWYDMTKTVNAYVNLGAGKNIFLSAIANCKVEPESLVFWTFSLRGDIQTTKENLCVKGYSNSECINEYIKKHVKSAFDYYVSKVVDVRYCRTTNKSKGAPMLLIGYKITKKPLRDNFLVEGKLNDLRCSI